MARWIYAKRFSSIIVLALAALVVTCNICEAQGIEEVEDVDYAQPAWSRKGKKEFYIIGQTKGSASATNTTFGVT